MNKTIKADNKLISRIVNSFDKEYFVNPPQYASYCIEYDDCKITIYQSNTILFQGKNAEIYYATFVNEQATPNNQLPQAGSDEVGTGDFFGPITVCACYIDETIYQKIKHLKLIDSKQLTDEEILKIAPTLIELVPHSLLILDNTTYNRVNKDNNMNAIKAKMHNKCYLNLIDKGIKLPNLVVIDDFCGERLYYQYNKHEAKVVGNITFETKAENKYISVACGAIISRYAFLKSMDQLSEKYQMTFPKGAGTIVDTFGKKFVEQYGSSELVHVAILNFKNLDKILGENTLF